MSYEITEKLLPDNRYSRPGAALRSVSGLVIHWTANTGYGANALANNAYFANLAKQVGDNNSVTFASAHYNVDDHMIIRNLPESEMGYHVGATNYNQDTLNLLNTTYPNNCTLGIEWCVNSDNDFNETWNRVAWLAADICLRYGLDPGTQMIRHYDVTWKDCPHFFTPNAPDGELGWQKFRDEVKSLMNPPKLYDVYQDNDYLSDFSTYADAVDEAMKWASSSVRLKSTNSWVWTNMAAVNKPVFTDIANHWAKDYIEHLDSLGLLSHPNDHLFNPDKAITRAEMATLISKAIALVGK